MKKLLFTTMLTGPLFFTTVFSQKNTVNKKSEQSNHLFSQANRLNFYDNQDSIAQSYRLLGEVLALNRNHTAGYESKICIDYKESKYKDALKTAIAYTSALPEWGNSWAYLGIVQRKLNDSASANHNFFKALEKYRSEAREWKRDRQALEIIRAKESIIKSFLGEYTPVFSNTKRTVCLILKPQVSLLKN
ncbi:hypothetical protein LWM68_35095 [Niabella sp. W65]|nr:hypothetical protein [Niabella sp. W65]MCH7367527.1 hypothetical protein [Niabella sp. W65]